ncbi:MAG TPA: hypothetical protein VMT80_02630 [Candidatus Paceibacterota bacterium]|nr:hypothetical protein [Candidatus Paceibacterota bacterium]
MDPLFLANILALLFSFFVVGLLLGVAFSKPVRDKVLAILDAIRRDLRLARVIHNPVLKPGDTPWTAEAVLNPAAIDLGGRVHLLYRAIGMDGVSRLGYASSPDGLLFDDRPPYPAYLAQNPRQGFSGARRYSPVLYPSGGSWGGCEDPRMVALGGRVYLTYNAFDGWDFIRVALTSIPVEDFLAKRFYKWGTPKLISPAGQIHKNWVLFPEKIGGKFAILHNLHGTSPDRVRVEYVEDLDEFDPDERGIESPSPASQAPRSIAWHSRMRGAGPPPLRTDKGWLVLYHATSEREGHRYQLGAMLLDTDDPEKVIARAHAPVLSPDEWYENDGKPGIVYACGALIRGDTLHVYYGGGDKVVCVATAALPAFLEALLAGGDSPLASAPLKAA